MLAVAGALVLGGCGSDGTEPAEQKPRKPSYVRAWEEDVERQEALYVSSAGYRLPEVHVTCYDTKVPFKNKLQGSCETEAFGTRTGDALDAEQLHERAYNIVYEKGRPSSFKVEPPMDDPLHVSP